MSRSSYNNTTTSGPGYERDYDERKERERERARAADRYDTEGRHHGKWTASGETADLENYGAALPGAYGDARRSQNLGHRSYSDREQYGDYRNRSYGSYDNYNQYGNNYGSIPAPPPMPPRDFWMPHNQYKNSHPYYPQYGHTSYDGRDFAGAHPQRGSHYGRDGNLYASRELYGMDHMYPSYGWSAFQPHFYGNDLFATEYEMSRLGLGSRSVIPGYSSVGGVATGRHLELGTTRPHVDIYELGNEYIIEIDLPGHSRDHIETKLFGNELIITSRPPKRDLLFHINERPLGRHEVTRKFYLPTDVNSGAINASLTNGVLRMVLPRTGKTLPTTTTVVDTSGSTTTTTQTTV